MDIDDKKFQELINQAMAELPERFTRDLKNVAILYEDEPTPEQRTRLKLRCNESLFGLYEGVPLAERQGQPRIYPDKITIFKNPMLHVAAGEAALKKLIKHTLWHEIAHYFGLDHPRIHELERGMKT